GTVIEGITGDPVQDCEVRAHDSTFDAVVLGHGGTIGGWSYFTGADGSYTMRSLRPGVDCKVYFRPWENGSPCEGNHRAEWFDNKLDWASADPVNPPATGIDAVLSAISSCNPEWGPPGQTLDVEIVGCDTHFTEGVSEASFSGTGINVNSTTVTDSTHATANITVLPGAPVGPRDVNVSTGNEVPEGLDGGFTVNTAPPTPGITSISPTSGQVGTEVTVNGTNFGTTQGSSYVKFNTTKVTDYVSWSDTKIKCKVSSGATTGEVKVTTDGGASNGKTFTVTSPPPPPTPDVTRVVPESGPPGTEVTISGSGFGNTQGSGETGGSASYVAFGGVPATEYKLWSDTKIICTVPQGAAAGAVTVVTSAGTSNTDRTFTVDYPTWYLAEGSTAWGFDCYITVENPNDSQVQADVTYMTPSGEVPGGTITMVPMSQYTMNPADILGEEDFSTRVECVEGKTIAVDRTMTWHGPGVGEWAGAHNSIGVTSPAKTWYLPEGSSDWGFECYLLIQNPNDTPASCTVTYMTADEGPLVFTKTVDANSRATYNIADDIGAKDASIMVEGNIPVIPERSMYRNDRREGHDSIGATTPASDYYLAEGSTGWGFTTYVLIQNPNPEPVDVTLTYMTPEGPQPQAPFAMEPRSRHTIKVNEVPGMENQDFSIKVTGSMPIIAERAMYWDTWSGEASHDSIGVAGSHRVFYLPDGDSYYDATAALYSAETFTLVMNPNESDVEVRISYLTETGTDNVVFTDTVPANSRRTYNMQDQLQNARAAIMVESMTPGNNIMVERAMYILDRIEGTSTIGGYSD
ncbi:MAG: IPT/TIG domain-containing protein, partial [Actinobacteria bacterium]|nr:IPT/TIG domain-containing protein [Actinomycetota bacterium]MCG2818742.1 IPT/TIG domain-containing protein [Actinomycetes bacterium]